MNTIKSLSKIYQKDNEVLVVIYSYAFATFLITQSQGQLAVMKALIFSMFFYIEIHATYIQLDTIIF